MLLWKYFDNFISNGYMFKRDKFIKADEMRYYFNNMNLNEYTLTEVKNIKVIIREIQEENIKRKKWISRKNKKRG